jgi:hypothetical protein
MISFLNVFSNAGWRRIYSSILAASDSDTFRLNPRYLPECISGAVTESRIYPRVRMEFSDSCSLRCSWKTVDEAACGE